MLRFLPALLTLATLITVPFAATAQACHPSYRGVCIPPATTDADCAKGGGNGPVYVQGPIRVVGPDPYELDRDGDGIACE